MFAARLNFESLFYKHSWSFYILSALYFLLGIGGGIISKFSFPGMYHNAPYAIAFLEGLISLTAIFPITILVAQTFFREEDAGFASILYASPLTKWSYIGSKFVIVVTVSTAYMLFCLLGVALAHGLHLGSGNEYLAFNLMFYLYPFLLFVWPNVFLCAATIFSIAVVSRHKMSTYLSGLLLYVLYIVISLFSNSPVMANASPPSPEAMAWAARLDPFGLAALFEQSRYWSIADRNTKLFQLQGHLLVNRLFYTGIISILLCSVLWKFKMVTGNVVRRKRKAKQVSSSAALLQSYVAVPVNTKGFLYHFRVIKSFVAIELDVLCKSISWILILVGWAFFLMIEIYSAIDSGIRIPAKFATTGLMVNTILSMSGIPMMLVILFYSNEITWKPKDVKIDALEQASPLSLLTRVVANWVTISCIPLLLITWSILIAIVMQCAYHHPVIEWEVYAELYYIVGLPAIISILLISSSTLFISKKYLSLGISMLLLFAFQSKLGKLIYLDHPLLRWAEYYGKIYSDMNAWGAYLPAFSIAMFYSFFLALLVFCLLMYIKKGRTWLGRWKIKPYFRYVTILACLGCAIFAYKLLAGDIRASRDARNAWKAAYEKKYRDKDRLPLLTVTKVRTNIDLYPSRNYYLVSGAYNLVNKNNFPIHEAWIAVDKDLQWKGLELKGSKLSMQDDAFGQYIFTLDQPLQPGDSTKLLFEFEYHWYGNGNIDPFNAIVANGAFMRISNYYPSLGYQPGWEISAATDRKKWKLGPASPLKTLEDTLANPFPYKFIEWDATISTEQPQWVVGIGNLKAEWASNNRHYFQYTSGDIPFRFALSSAEYKVAYGQFEDIGIAVYYHADHAWNVDSLISKSRKTLEYCQHNFGPYPYDTIRFAEISSFTRGFDATAYPATIFMNENSSFTVDTHADDEQDLVANLSSHELSHQWWGLAQLSPPEMEGGQVLTESLAMYTELMLYQHDYGKLKTEKLVSMHQQIYDTEKGLSEPRPLYRADPGSPFIYYNLGAVRMYRLSEIIGEASVNKALKNLLRMHAYPGQPATVLDLIDAFHRVSPLELHPKIDSLFME